MMESKALNELLDAVARILLRCFVLGYALLLLWAAVYLFADNVLYVPALRLFGLTSHEVDVIQYCGIAFVKCLVLLFFLFPYIAIRWVLRNRASMAAIASGEPVQCRPTTPQP
jgi:hypothetical protein